MYSNSFRKNFRKLTDTFYNEIMSGVHFDVYNAVLINVANSIGEPVFDAGKSTITIAESLVHDWKELL